MARIRCLPAALALLSLVAACRGAWTPADFPNPSTPAGAAACGRPVPRSAVCDPDNVIGRAAADVVEGTIKDIENAVDPYRADGCSRHASDLPGFQVAVALMDRMQLVDQPPEKAAEAFAAQLFDSWGVGDSACGNGVLLLLSRVDRQVYILAGAHALRVTGKERLRSVIDRMRPLLREGRFDAALQAGVVDLGLVLARAQLPPGNDSSDATGQIIFYGFFASMIGLACWGSHKRRREQRRCRSLLDKLKREQASAVATGRYPAASCPVCFDDFERPSAPPLPPGGADATQPGTGGSREGGSPSEPLLERGAKAGGDAGEGPSSGSGAAGGGGGKQAPGAGGDKRPLELPCGHTFCEPCLSAWLNDHSSCPVCRRDVGQGDAPPGKQQQAAAAPPAAALYQEELLFRMGGLHRMYPTIVTRDMVDHTAQAAGQGQHVDWEAMRQMQLAAQATHHHQQQGSSGAAHDFGGGSHSGGGGVGGSW